MLYIHYVLVFKEIKRHNPYDYYLSKDTLGIFRQGRINHRTNHD